MELSLIFKLDFYPFFSFTENNYIYFVGNKVEAYNNNRKIYSYRLNSRFISACKLGNSLFILTDNQVINFSYKNNKVINSIKSSFSSINCYKNNIALSNNTQTYIFDTNFKNLSVISLNNLIGDFISDADTVSKRVRLISISNLDTLTIRNFEGFIPYFGKKDSIYSLIAGFSKRNFYLYFFENKSLRWYNKISVKIILSNAIINPKDRTILLYGSSQRTFYINLKDISGEDIWIYNPRVLGIYLLDESFKDVLIENKKIIAVGYSMREGEKVGVIKVLDYTTGEEILHYQDQEVEDFIRILKVKEEMYLIGLSKKFIGVYRLDFKPKTIY
ncbi:MAG: hypothetical protein N2504_01775 [candidate division WOR-3 bacterium]|nr:hypothetical protein [candidate division WOR-3 bacterium]MCX7947300.1 hypothetical protein [candidate division WOR-3 bacterium]MDW8150143.1 hypothetical protein [candidate division WOR-3 bacterium]